MARIIRGRALGRNRLLLSTLIVVVVLVSDCFVGLTQARADSEFSAWVERLWPIARSKGISKLTFDKAFSGVTPDPAIVQRSGNQAEFVTPLWDYIGRRVEKRRIGTGREKLKKHHRLLKRIEKAYGVDRRVLVAIWGLESSYGAGKGRHNVIRSLATLAYKDIRKKFALAQLFAALQILESGDIGAKDMVGSWAGAMGHTQFIPTTYLGYAVDFDGDGKRNIWGSVADGLASAANYLKASKWRPGETWGYEVRLPKGFDYSLTGRKTVKRLKAWRKLGVKRVGGQAYPRPDDEASLILPVGANGPAFLILQNFRSILRYNQSVAYALAVGHLTDRLKGFGAFRRPWPKDETPLAFKERKELQLLLGRLGLLDGQADGIIGQKTRAAVKAYQRKKGLLMDGYPSVKLLQKLRQDTS